MTNQRGQSLTEMTVIVPLLLLIFIGLITIGRLMHAHLVIVNLSREIARVAVREDGLNFSGLDRQAIGYDKLRRHFDDITADDNWLDLDTNTSVTVHLLEFDAGRLCLIEPCLLDCLEINPDDLDTSDDFRRSPASWPLWVEHWGAESMPAGKIDYESRLDEMEQVTIKLACAASMRQPDNVMYQDDRAVVVEVAYHMEWWLLSGGVDVRRVTQMRLAR